MLIVMTNLQDHFRETPCGVHPSNAGKKFRSLLALRPTYFLAAAAGARHCFAINYKDNGAKLQPARGIPRCKRRQHTTQ